MTNTKFNEPGNRAFSILTLKAGQSDGTITGTASTPETDRQGDILVPEGATFKLPLPLLWQHDHSKPIGHVTSAKVTSKGISIVAKIAVGVSTEIDNAYRLIQAGLVQGLSVGFRTLESEPMARGYKINRWEWMELSACTLPCNAAATISSVKSAFGVKGNGAIKLVDPRTGPVKLINSRTGPVKLQGHGAIKLISPGVRLIGGGR
jgi:HK97 family phage prohead protease